MMLLEASTSGVDRVQQYPSPCEPVGGVSTFACLHSQDRNRSIEDCIAWSRRQHFLSRANLGICARIHAVEFIQKSAVTPRHLSFEAILWLRGTETAARWAIVPQVFRRAHQTGGPHSATQSAWSTSLAPRSARRGKPYRTTRLRPTCLLPPSRAYSMS
jgi:hypothetical protein